MNKRLVNWLQQVESHIVDRRDSTGCLILVEASVPLLMALLGLQWWAWRDEAARALYRPGWMVPSMWAQAALIAWLSVMGFLAWQRRHERQAIPWLVHMTVLPAGLGLLSLALAHGLKDTPMSTVVMSAFVLTRALFPWKRMRLLLPLGVAMVLLAEAFDFMGWLPYAPLLSHPVYRSATLDPWWAIWVRVLFTAAALPLSGMLFFLAATFRRHRQALETMVRTDMLTGLSNRREFMTRLEREAHRQARSGRPMSVVMCDVDHFKHVNDTWGHPVGDEVLARIGHILRTQTRENVDTAARYGGEEFVLLLPETDLAGAQQVAEKIAAKLREQEFVANGHTFKVTQSLGIAQVVEGDTHCALKVADRNLYQAKQSGRDRIVATVAFAEEACHV